MGDILHNFRLDVASNEYCNMYSVNRSISALAEMDAYLARLAAQAGIQSYSENAVYQAGDYVWYKTSRRAMNVYLLRSLVDENVEPPRVLSDGGYQYVVSNEYWEVYNSDNNVDGLNIVDIAGVYRTYSMNQLKSYHEKDAAYHKFGKFSRTESNVLKADLKNISSDRKRFLSPFESYADSNMIMRKWPNGILEYDVKYQMSNFDGLLTIRGCNDYYLGNTAALGILSAGDVKVCQIQFKEPFVDFNYMIYGSSCAEATGFSTTRAIQRLAADKAYINSVVDFGEYGLVGVERTVSWHADEIPADGIVRIPPHVDVIAAYAFEDFGRGAERLSVIPENLSDSRLEDVNDFAFFDSGVTYVQLPKSVKRTGKGVFSGCSALSLVDVYVETSSNSQFDFGEGSFTGCSPDLSVVIHEDDFPNPFSTENLYSRLTSNFGYYGLTAADVVTRINDFDQTDPSKHQMQTFTVDEILGRNIQESRSISQAAPAVDDYRIQNHAYGENCMTYFKIDPSISAIGDYAFEYCHALSDVTNCGVADVLSGISEIGEYAFYDCSAMTELSLFGVRKIGENAFLGTRISCLYINSDADLTDIVDTDVGIGLDIGQVIQYAKPTDRHAGGIFSSTAKFAAGPNSSHNSVMFVDKTQYGFKAAALDTTRSDGSPTYRCHIVGRWK